MTQDRTEHPISLEGTRITAKQSSITNFSPRLVRVGWKLWGGGGKPRTLAWIPAVHLDFTTDYVTNSREDFTSSGPLRLEGLHSYFGDSSKMSWRPVLLLNGFLLCDLGNSDKTHGLKKNLFTVSYYNGASRKRHFFTMSLQVHEFTCHVRAAMCNNDRRIYIFLV